MFGRQRGILVTCTRQPAAQTAGLMKQQERQQQEQKQQQQRQQQWCFLYRV
jgi:hypothetical protein